MIALKHTQEVFIPASELAVAADPSVVVEYAPITNTDEIGVFHPWFRGYLKYLLGMVASAGTHAASADFAQSIYVDKADANNLNAVRISEFAYLRHQGIASVGLLPSNTRVAAGPRIITPKNNFFLPGQKLIIRYGETGTIGGDTRSKLVLSGLILVAPWGIDPTNPVNDWKSVRAY